VVIEANLAYLPPVDSFVASLFEAPIHSCAIGSPSFDARTGR